MQSKGQGTNTFNGGLNTDLHPLVVQNNQYVDALNAEIMTVGENQYVMKNIPGNETGNGKGFSLTDGFIPLAVKTFNNVAYIISGKFGDDGTFELGEVGTYPSPVWDAYNPPTDADLDFNEELLGSYTDETMSYLTSLQKFKFNDDALGRHIDITFDLTELNGTDTLVDVYIGELKSEFCETTGAECPCKKISTNKIYEDLDPAQPVVVTIEELASHEYYVYFVAKRSSTTEDFGKKILLACSMHYGNMLNSTLVTYAGVNISEHHYEIAEKAIKDMNSGEPVLSSDIREFYMHFHEASYVLSNFPGYSIEEYYGSYIIELKIKYPAEFPDLSNGALLIRVVSTLNVAWPEDTVPMRKIYSPLYNFLTDEFGDSIPPEDWDDDTKHTMAFSTNSFKLQLEDFIDLTLQKEYDESINFIFTDGRNPVRLINSRFKINPDGSASIIDRRQNKDTSTYSSKYFNQTELIVRLDNVPVLNFIGVESGGVLKGGGYRYYFKYRNADGNLSDIIAESSLISIHQGFEDTALGVDGSTSTDKLVKFELLDIGVSTGTIEVFFTHGYGDVDESITAFKILRAFDIDDDGKCSIIHIGVENVEAIQESELNTQYSSVDKVKTLTQINNRLVLGNISSELDADLMDALESVSKKMRISETIESMEGSYGNPDNVYNNLGYWAGETYELGICYILNDMFVTPAFPVRGLDNYGDDGVYSGDMSGCGPDDIEIISPNGIVGDAEKIACPGINEFENVRGLYRTAKVKELITAGKVNVTKLKIDLSPLNDTNNPEYGFIQSNVKGYFIVRKDRKKDTLVQGYIMPTAMLPAYNVDSIVYDLDYLGLRRNTAVVVGTDEVPDATKTYLGWDNGEGVNGIPLEKGSNKTKNLYDLDMVHVPQLLDRMLLVHPKGFKGWSAVGRVPRTNRVAFVSSDIEVNSANIAGLLDSNTLNLIIDLDAVDVTLGEDEVIYIDATVTNMKTPESFKADLTFLSEGMTSFAHGEFTSKIDRSFSYLVSAFSMSSPTFRYRTMSALQVSSDCSSDGCWGGIAYDKNSNCEGHAFINYTTYDGENVKDWVRRLMKGDRVWFSDDGDRDIKTEDHFNDHGTCSVRDFGAGNELSDESHQNVRFHYHTPPDEYLFIEIIEQPDTMKAMGHAKTSTDDRLSVQLWDTGTLGINKTAAWKTEKQAGEIYVFPYATVVNNYSQYVGCKLFDPVTGLEKPFEHDYGANKMHLTDIKTSDIELTSGELAVMYASSFSLSYYSTSQRHKLSEGLDFLTLGGGDCFITRTYKQMTYPIGIEEAILANMGDYYTYGSGPMVERAVGDIESDNPEIDSSEFQDDGRKLVSNGYIIELVHQNNNNTDVRSLETVEKAEKAVHGTDKGFYPKFSPSKLYAEYRRNSKAYNHGLSGTRRAVSYISLDYRDPIYNQMYPNRVMLSSPNITSEYVNGYRDFSGLNFRDYNSELGQIIKLETFNNILFAIFEKGVGVITVDGRTLVNQSNEIYVDDIQALAPKAQLLSTTVGSINPESITTTYSTIYGVDLQTNKVWKLNGKQIMVISDYSVEQLLLEAKDGLNKYTDKDNNVIKGIPKIYLSYDGTKKNVAMLFSKLFNTTPDVVRNVPISSGRFFASDLSLYYNEVLGKWISRLSFSPKFQIHIHDDNMVFDLNVTESKAWETNKASNYCNFMGEQHKFEIEVVMHEAPSSEKILTNLIMLSNKVKPDEIKYTITGDFSDAVLRDTIVNYYNEEGNIDYTGNTSATNSKPEVSYTEKILTRMDSPDMSIGIFSENAYYKDGKYFIQVGKSNSFSRFSSTSKRIRDKYFKIRITYTGEDYTYIYAMISQFIINFD